VIYKLNSEENKQIKNLNAGYNSIKRGLKLILENAPKNDGDIDTWAYRANKFIDKIVRKSAKLLEAQYIEKEFFDIVKIIDKRTKEKK
jgi:hypothetical protein